MSEPKIPFRDTWPADVSIRDDAALGRAYRRAETALPKGWHIRFQSGAFMAEDAICTAEAWAPDASGAEQEFGPTPADALGFLADALESRRDRPVDDAASPTASSTSRPDAPR